MGSADDMCAGARPGRCAEPRCWRYHSTSRPPGRPPARPPGRWLAVQPAAHRANFCPSSSSSSSSSRRIPPGRYHGDRRCRHSSRCRRRTTLSHAMAQQRAPRQPRRRRRRLWQGNKRAFARPAGTQRQQHLRTPHRAAGHTHRLASAPRQSVASRRVASYPRLHAFKGQSQRHCLQNSWPAVALQSRSGSSWLARSFRTTAYYYFRFTVSKLAFLCKSHRRLTYAVSAESPKNIWRLLVRDYFHAGYPDTNSVTGEMITYGAAQFYAAIRCSR